MAQIDCFILVDLFFVTGISLFSILSMYSSITWFRSR